MIEYLRKQITGKKVCLLGFGREGQSTYRLIRKYFPEMPITVADRNPRIKDIQPLARQDENVDFRTGNGYLAGLNEYDIIFKSPGIPLFKLNGIIPARKITSQTDIFLKVYRDQIVGITGTKGKSTTSSLIRHIVGLKDPDALLVGNIGIPPFDVYNKINHSSVIIFEMSSHQLEVLSRGPRIALILNIFPEHLDHFRDITAYQSSKLNITHFQNEWDYLISNADDPLLSDALSGLDMKRIQMQYSMVQDVDIGCMKYNGQIKYINKDEEVLFPYSNLFKLKGDHNIQNMMASLITCKLLNVPDEVIIEGYSTFQGLRHRLEYIGEYGGVRFYDDSIATIPEAAIEAIKSLRRVDTIILGGFDRDLDYSYLISFLLTGKIKNIICTGEAGKRIYEEIKFRNAGKKLCFAKNYHEVFDYIRKVSNPGETCLLSPAAASYDMFRNFEERGDEFARLARDLGER